MGNNSDANEQLFLSDFIGCAILGPEHRLYHPIFKQWVNVIKM